MVVRRGTNDGAARKQDSAEAPGGRIRRPARSGVVARPQASDLTGASSWDAEVSRPKPDSAPPPAESPWPDEHRVNTRRAAITHLAELRAACNKPAPPREDVDLNAVTPIKGVRIGNLSIEHDGTLVIEAPPAEATPSPSAAAPTQPDCTPAVRRIPTPPPVSEYTRGPQAESRLATLRATAEATVLAAGPFLRETAEYLHERLERLQLSAIRPLATHLRERLRLLQLSVQGDWARRARLGGAKVAVVLLAASVASAAAFISKPAEDVAVSAAAPSAETPPARTASATPTATDSDEQAAEAQGAAAEPEREATKAAPAAPEAEPFDTTITRRQRRSWSRAMARGHLFTRRGDPTRAAWAYERAVGHIPDNPESMEHLARALLAAGNTRRAIAAYRRVIDLNPEDARLHVATAEAYMAAKTFRLARRAYERALSLDPGYLSAQLALERVEEIIASGGKLNSVR